MPLHLANFFRRLPLRVGRCFSVAVIACSLVSAAPAPANTESAQGLTPILDYISTAWDVLTRSMTDCKSVVDPKLKVAPVLYLPAGFDEPPAVKKLAADCNVQVEHLPVEIHRLGEIDT